MSARRRLMQNIKRRRKRYAACDDVEQDTGVEPASAAWEAAVLPMYESCRDPCGCILSPGAEKCNRFLPGPESFLCRFYNDV